MPFSPWSSVLFHDEDSPPPVEKAPTQPTSVKPSCRTALRASRAWASSSQKPHSGCDPSMKVHTRRDSNAPGFAVCRSRSGATEAPPLRGHEQEHPPGGCPSGGEWRLRDPTRGLAVLRISRSRTGREIRTAPGFAVCRSRSRQRSALSPRSHSSVGRSPYFAPPTGREIRTAPGFAVCRSCSGATSSRASASPLESSNLFSYKNQKGVQSTPFWFLVGAERFELSTPCSQSRCATRLRHAPME